MRFGQSIYTPLVLEKISFLIRLNIVEITFEMQDRPFSQLRYQNNRVRVEINLVWNLRSLLRNGALIKC